MSNFPGLLSAKENGGAKVVVTSVEELTWHQIFKAAREGVETPEKYTNIGYSYSVLKTTLKISGDGVSDILVELPSDIEVCEATVSGTCFKYFFGTGHALPAQSKSN